MVEGVAMTSGEVSRLQEVVGRVQPVDFAWCDRAEVRLAELTKPPRMQWNGDNTVGRPARPDPGPNKAMSIQVLAV